MGFIAETFGGILRLIYSIIPNFGVAIIIFGILTRLILVPFYFKQIKSSKIMMKINPKVKEIQRKYASDRQTMQRKLMDLYAEHGYSPFAGCLPTIIQFILIIGMFSALRNPGVYVFTDQTVLQEATHQYFLWVPNLSKPDLLSNVISTDLISFAGSLPGILPIFSAVMTYFQMAYAPTMSTPPKTAPNQGAQQSDSLGSMNRMFKIIFPVLILLYGVSFDAGIVIYWTVGTIFSLLQTLIVNKVLEKQEESVN